MKGLSRIPALAGALFAAQSAMAIQLDITNVNSIQTAASTIAHGMMSYYTGNQTGGTPGLLPAPSYWWEAGAMFGSLIDYWYYTGDSTYNDVVSQALLFQTGPDADFMPPNQTKSEGNDDQGFWGMAAMSAAEVKFPNPSPSQPQWLALAQAVFNSQALRWDNTSCAGGLKWQIFTFNTGYNYKNSISNGCFFNLAARLGYYTKNQTYLDWAEREWEWVESVGLISPIYQVFDGTNDDLNCSQLNHLQWSYNAGVYLLGASVMWNQTTGATQSTWEARVRGLVTATSVFFQNNIMYEVACEPSNNCDTDQQSFKAYLSRWMAASSKVAPFVADLVALQLQTSAKAAAASCSGGNDGVTCGTKWTVGAWDNTWGVGQQMNALEVIQGLLIDSVPGPVSNTTGGISVGNPAAGTGGDTNPGAPTGRISTGDRAGAGILTAGILVALLGGAWLLSGMLESPGVGHMGHYTDDFLGG
ncbi:hypothetical protein LTR02_002741 [Friedmanniomyces endolithicus]|nr:hypothetical protein LTR38_007153 [Friedmanniomyces endolithicus]KAK0809896.1 hypothetical protein LTR75_005753 [Friedmanniomyces endolithicus]KAK0912590.1 hypothetical protein LTR02_002741 [Friedmanniomyces endolithicus]KAK0924490.1 hypothetical protein LTR57_005714 [Friedmanniomyces endolithicus]